MNCMSSCRSQFNNTNFCETLKSIDDNDQIYRNLIPMPYFTIMDSLRRVNKITLVEYSKLPRKTQKSYGDIARKIAKNRQPSKIEQNEIDSLMSKQIILDNKNTELLIEIIKKRGYPNRENCNCTIFPKTVFRHSQPQYFEKIRPLILKEFKAGRLNKFDYNFILHHLNGRKKSERHLIKG